jgi:hypothetical protein
MPRNPAEFSNSEIPAGSRVAEMKVVFTSKYTILLVLFSPESRVAALRK